MVALIVSAISYTSDLLSWAQKKLMEADTATPSVFGGHDEDPVDVSFNMDEGTSVDEGNAVDSMTWDCMDAGEDLEEEVSSFELSCSSLFSMVEDVDMGGEICMDLSLVSTSREMWYGLPTESLRIAFIEEEEELSSDEFGSVSFWSVVEDEEMEEGDAMDSSFSSTLSVMSEVLDDMGKELFRDEDVKEDCEVELSSVELSNTSLFSLTLDLDILQTSEDFVGLVDGEEAEVCLDSFSIGQGGELELCSVEQSSCSPAVESEPVVVTRSGRRSRRPDRLLHKYLKAKAEFSYDGEDTINKCHWLLFHTYIFQSLARPISYRGLMMVIVAGFIPLPPLTIVSTMVMWESSQWLGKKIVQSMGKRDSRKAWIGALAAAI